MRASPRETCVSLRPHAMSSPRPVTRPQDSSAFRANPIKFVPNRLARPMPCETPPPLRAPRGEGKRTSISKAQLVSSSLVPPAPNSGCDPASLCFVLRFSCTTLPNADQHSPFSFGILQSSGLLAKLTSCAAACGLSSRGVSSSKTCQTSSRSACTNRCGRRSMPSASSRAPPGGTLRWGGGGA